MPLTEHIAHVAMSQLEQLDVDANFSCRQCEEPAESLTLRDPEHDAVASPRVSVGTR